MIIAQVSRAAALASPDFVVEVVLRLMVTLARHLSRGRDDIIVLRCVNCVVGIGNHTC